MGRQFVSCQKVFEFFMSSLYIIIIFSIIIIIIIIIIISDFTYLYCRALCKIWNNNKSHDLEQNQDFYKRKLKNNINQINFKIKNHEQN